MRSLSLNLINWYRENRRSLPWRKDRNPYRIWISEVMLQQTTVVAVIPFYEKFLARFPNVQSLAKADLQEVLQYWAGLGYYSRARNLHRAAQQLQTMAFPQTYQELLDLPGFGPYTARAVASLAFSQKAGVLDGNVIRVLSRVLGLSVAWWTPQGRATLQELADQMVQFGPSEDVNQGLMELGATVCTPKNPSCVLCPWLKSCQAQKTSQVDALPLKKPRKKSEIWVWDIDLHAQKKKGTSDERYAFVKNDYTPFLKGELLPPGRIQKQKLKPKKFHVQHAITHHQIVIRIRELPLPLAKTTSPYLWLTQKEVLQQNPSSVLKKIFACLK